MKIHVVFYNEWAQARGDSLFKIPFRMGIDLIQFNVVWYAMPIARGCRKRQIVLALLGFKVIFLWYS